VGGALNFGLVAGIARETLASNAALQALEEGQ
jgi:hypothetical protein